MSSTTTSSEAAAAASGSGGQSPGTASKKSKGKSQSEALNASHIERRRLKRKYTVKRLEKKLENYHRQIKRFVI